MFPLECVKSWLVQKYLLDLRPSFVIICVSLCFYMFSIESISKAGQFQITYQILVYFHVFIKCLSKAGQFQSTYQILGYSLFFICLIPLIFVSFHSINQISKRSLDIYDLPHGPLLPLAVSIKPYSDSIAQWTKTYNYLSSQPKLVLFACNLSPLKLFALKTFHLKQ